MREGIKYVPFFVDMVEALQELEDFDKDMALEFFHMIVDYVLNGVEPEAVGPLKALFISFRSSLDKTINRAESNSKNRRVKRSAGEETVDEPEENVTNQNEPERNETNENETKRNVTNENEPERNVTNQNETAYKPIANSQKPIANSQRPKKEEDEEDRRSSSSSVPEAFSIPSRGEWIAYFNAKCKERGIPPDSEAAGNAWGHYEDHGWCHKDGTGFKNWHRQAATCIGRYARDLEKRQRGGTDGGYFNAATRRFDENAILIESF